MMKTAVLYCSPTCYNCIEMEENMSAVGMKWIHADITKIHWRTEAGKAHVQSFPTLVFYGTKENGKMFPVDTHVGLLPVRRIKEIYNPAEDYYRQELPKEKKT